MAAIYEFTARNESGEEFTGTRDNVDSVAMLTDELAKMGDTLLKAKRSKSKTKKQPKVKLDEIINFVYKFGTMYSAGLPITQSLEAIGQETENDDLRYVLLDIQQSVETGATLKDAFQNAILEDMEKSNKKKNLNYLTLGFYFKKGKTLCREKSKVVVGG